MFHKPCRVKSQTQLKGSEKKKLNLEILQNFPSLTEDDLSAILPPKCDINLIKAFCSKGEIVHVYQIQKEPFFFKIDKSNELYPTVYCLYKYPTLIKTFTTSTPVISKLMQGADLMLPGIHIQGNLKLNSYGKFEKGTMVAINTDDNICPFAIGKTALSSMDMYMSARQGKGVIVLHIYRDFLWEMGTKSPIPNISSLDNLLGCESLGNEKDSETDIENMTDMIEDTDISNDIISTENEEQPALSEPEAMDELFQYCFLKALKTSAKKVELPILTSNFYRLHMVNVCPNGKTLDIKKSSYKKLSKFLNAMAAKNFIEVKEFPKGVENITGVNFAHEDLKQFIVDETEVCTVSDSRSLSSNTFVPPTLEEVYQVSGTTVQFFKRNRLNKGEVLSRADVRAVVSSYIEKNNLKRDDKVEVDPLLHEAVVSPKEGYKEFLRWDEIFSRLLGKMAPAVRISREGQVPIVRKGKLEPIEIAIAKRTGNKKVTLIYNIGVYGIDENEFAHQIQVGVATSTCVGAAENKPQGTTQILVQGNQVLFIGKLLLDTYKLPRKYIKGLELAQKRKK